MDKNAIKDNISFFFGGGSTLMGLILAALIAYFINLFTGWNIFLTFGTSVLSMMIIVHIINEIRWAIKYKNGFLEIIPDSEINKIEGDSFAWITVSPRNKGEKLRLSFELKKFMEGSLITGTNYSIGNEHRYFEKDLEIETFEKIELITTKVKVMFLTVLKQRGEGKDEIPFVSGNIIQETKSIDDGEGFSISVSRNIMPEHSYTMVLEVYGKIDNKYIFSELWEFSFVHKVKSTNIFDGDEEKFKNSVTSYIEWQTCKRIDLEEIQKRNIFREIVNLKDGMLNTRSN